MVNEAWPSQIELSPENRQLLEGIRNGFISALQDYKDDIPEDIMTDKPCTHKCQNNWFFATWARLSMASKIIPQEILTDRLSRRLQRASFFIEAYANRNIKIRNTGKLHICNAQNIKNANIVIEKVIKEIDNLLLPE